MPGAAPSDRGFAGTTRRRLARRGVKIDNSAAVSAAPNAERPPPRLGDVQPTVRLLWTRYLLTTRQRSRAVTASAARCSACQERQSPQSAAAPRPDARQIGSCSSQRQQANSLRRLRASSRQRRAALAKLAQLVGDAPLDGGKCGGRNGLNVNKELPAALRRGVPRLDGGAFLVDFDKRPPEPRTAARREEVGDDVEHRGIGMAARYGAPAQQAARRRIGLAQGRNSRRRFCAGSTTRGRRRGWLPGGIPPNWRSMTASAFGPHVACNNQDRAVRAIVCLVKRL